MNKSSAVFFDIDGVLLDSLPQHLQICRDKAIEYGLHLSVPTEQEFRRLVMNGVKISPMQNFFLAVGFPKETVGQAVKDYERDFQSKYRPKKFPGVDKTLHDLVAAGFKLGLVTSNTRSNIEPSLGKAIEFFDPEALFFYDSALAIEKSEHLVSGAKRFGLEPVGCWYVGDQPADELAAVKAGFQFLGVTYGWGIAGRGASYPALDTVAEIAPYLISRQN